MAVGDVISTESLTDARLDSLILDMSMTDNLFSGQNDALFSGQYDDDLAITSNVL